MEEKRRLIIRGLFFCVFLFAFAFSVVIILFGVGSYFALYRPTPFHDNILAVKGDDVELNYKANGYTRLSSTLLFTLQNVTNSTSSAETVVAIYEIDCNNEHTFQETVFFSSPNSFPQFEISSTILVSNCSNYPGICILDEYIYATSGSLTYNITLYPFTPGLTKVRIIVYDDLEYYKSFFDGTGIGNAVWTKAVNLMNFEFTFEINHSSYYFFAIEFVDSSVQWFNYSLGGFIVVYNTSTLNPECYINSTNNFTCEMKISESSDKCFLTYVEGQRNSSSPKQDELVYINAKETFETEDYIFVAIVYITPFTVVLILFLFPFVIMIARKWCNNCSKKYVLSDEQNLERNSSFPAEENNNEVSGSYIPLHEIDTITEDNRYSFLTSHPPNPIIQVAYTEGHSNTPDAIDDSEMLEIHSDPDPQRVTITSSNNTDDSEMTEIHSGPDHQRVSVTISNETDDSEMPLLSFSHNVEVEAPEEYKKNKLGSFDELFEKSFDENGLFYHSYKYGVTIIIPPGAVRKPCTLQFGTCLLLPHFRSNHSFIPVSPFVWIHIDSLLSKPAELYIPHYVDVSSDEDKMKLCLITTKENPEVFTTDELAQVSYSSTLARILTTHFCSLCVASKDVPHKRYILLYAEKEFDDGSLHVDICIMYSIRCLQRVEEQLKEYKENKILRRGPVSFSDDSNGISVTFDPIHVPGWIIDFRDIHFEKITEDMIDIYKVLGCTPETVTDYDIEDLKGYEEADIYPPWFKLQFSPENSQSGNNQVTLSLHGLKNTFSRTIRLGKEYPDSYSTSPVSSLSSNTSGYDSFSSGAASTPTTSSQVILSPTSQSSDTFLVDLMNFLESKLRSKWYQFGHHLKLPIEELHRIELTVGQDNERCTRQVLFMWRRLNPATSWEPIAEALEQSGLSLLSAIVTKRYTNPGPTFCRICQCTHGLDYTDFDIHDVLTSIPNNSLLQSAPDISKLSDLVGAEIPAKWELFGVQVGLEQSYLDCLRDEHHDSKIRFIHLFNEWKTMKTSDFTWATVIKVLYSKTISEYTLAENILKKLKNLQI